MRAVLVSLHDAVHRTVTTVADHGLRTHLHTRAALTMLTLPRQGYTTPAAWSSKVVTARDEYGRQVPQRTGSSRIVQTPRVPLVVHFEDDSIGETQAP